MFLYPEDILNILFQALNRHNPKLYKDLLDLDPAEDAKEYPPERLGPDTEALDIIIQQKYL